MKTVKNLSGIIILLILISSCYTSREFVDDDVYILKSNELPIGESLTDETSYASYKHRKKLNKTSDNYYQEERNYLYETQCSRYNFDPYGCGCSYYGWNMYSNYRYNPYGLYYGHGMYYAFGNYVYDPFSGMYVYNPFYNPYDYYYGGFYYPYPYYYGGAYNYYGTMAYSAPAIHTNQHMGPRTSISGYGNRTGRNNPILLKNTQSGSNKPKPQTVSALRDRPVGSFENKNRPQVVNQNIQTRPAGNVSKTYRPSGESRTYPGTIRSRPTERPYGNPQRPPQNREINQPRPNRETTPKGSGRGGNPGESRQRIPGGRRN